MHHVLMQPLVQFRASSGLSSRSPGARVLVVDDDPDSRTALVVFLKAAGLCVVAAATAREALAALKTARFDLAIIDVILPDIRGDKLLSRLRTFDRCTGRLPAIAVTGYGSYRNQKRVRRAGFDAYFVKPADFGRLLDTISRLLGSST